MGKVLIIGAGGVGRVVAHKCALAGDVFKQITLASRTESKCRGIAEEIKNSPVKTARVDADDVPELVALLRAERPDLVINVALPYQDLTVMDHAAISLARENAIPIMVFSIYQEGAFAQVVRGQGRYTIITSEV